MFFRITCSCLTVSTQVKWENGPNLDQGKGAGDGPACLETGQINQLGSDSHSRLPIEKQDTSTGDRHIPLLIPSPSISSSRSSLVRSENPMDVVSLGFNVSDRSHGISQRDIICTCKTLVCWQ